MNTSTLRNAVESDFVAASSRETERNRVALACLNAALDAYFSAHGVKEENFALEHGMSKGNWSRMRTGLQAFPVNLLDEMPMEVVGDFLHRMNESTQADPMTIAAEQLALAAVRYLRTARGAAVWPRPKAVKVEPL